jgi:hypothetical protein
MDTAAYLYPWDVLGDPAAADLVAGLGLHHVTLAALYHATRALTPRHPRHRVVVAEHTAAYYPVSQARWATSALRPTTPSWQPGDSFGTAARALRAAGVGVHAWVVVNHVDLPGPAEFAVLNAYGDRYPWALCPAREAVGEYAVGLAADVVALPDISGVELESCGWYGFDHLSAHDKVGGVPLAPAAQYLLSLCFCDACQAAYRAAGLDPVRLKAQVRAALDPIFAGESTTAGGDEPEAIVALLGAQVTAAVFEVRQAIADRLRAAMVERIRADRPELAILAHASPQPHRYTAFTGLDPARAGELFDGLVVNCWPGPKAARDTRRLAGPALPVQASLLAVAGMGGRPDTLIEQARQAAAAGASGIRLYHAGLAGHADLAAVRELTQAI